MLIKFYLDENKLYKLDKNIFETFFALTKLGHGDIINCACIGGQELFYTKIPMCALISEYVRSDF